MLLSCVEVLLAMSGWGVVTWLLLKRRSYHEIVNEIGRTLEGLAVAITAFFTAASLNRIEGWQLFSTFAWYAVAVVVFCAITTIWLEIQSSRHAQRS